MARLNFVTSLTIFVLCLVAFNEHVDALKVARSSPLDKLQVTRRAKTKVSHPATLAATQPRARFFKHKEHSASLAHPLSAEDAELHEASTSTTIEPSELTVALFATMMFKGSGCKAANLLSQELYVVTAGELGECAPPSGGDDDNYDNSGGSFYTKATFVNNVLTVNSYTTSNCTGDVNDHMTMTTEIPTNCENYEPGYSAKYALVTELPSADLYAVSGGSVISYAAGGGEDVDYTWADAACDSDAVPSKVVQFTSLGVTNGGYKASDVRTDCRPYIMREPGFVYVDVKKRYTEVLGFKTGAGATPTHAPTKAPTKAVRKTAAPTARKK